MRIQQHEFKSEVCIHCGQPSPSVSARGLKCCWRDVPDSGLSPEPQRRVYACEDWDAIADFLKRLREGRNDSADK